jgi:hypothetical protein
MAASVQARHGAKGLLEILRLRPLWVDRVHLGQLMTSIWALRPWRKICLAIVQRSDNIQGFHVIFEGAGYRFPTTSAEIVIRVFPDTSDDFYALP